MSFQGKLSVNVHGCRDLHKVQMLGEMDPYVKLQFKDEKFKTKVAKNGHKTPLFEQEFIFNIVKADDKDMLFLTVCNSEIGHDDIIGKASIPISRVLQFKMGQKVVIELLDVEKFSKIHGYCDVTFNWTPEGTADAVSQQAGSVTEEAKQVVQQVAQDHPEGHPPQLPSTPCYEQVQPGYVEPVPQYVPIQPLQPQPVPIQYIPIAQPVQPFQPQPVQPIIYYPPQPIPTVVVQSSSSSSSAPSNQSFSQSASYSGPVFHEEVKKQEKQEEGKKQAIKDGLYFIRDKNSGKYMDVSGAGMEDGVSLHIWEYHGKTNQQFFFQHQPENNSFLIKAHHSGKILDISGENKNNGAKLHQWKNLNQNNQRFFLRPTGEDKNTFFIEAVHSGKVLDVSGGSKENGAMIHQWDKHGGLNQQWILEKIQEKESSSFSSNSKKNLEDGTYFIRCKQSGKYLDISGASQQDGAILHQWNLHRGTNQQFQLRKISNSDSTFIITVVHSGKVLDVAGISQDNGAQIHQWGFGNGENQKWKIFPRADEQEGSHLQALHSGKVMDVYGQSKDDGAKVVQWDFNGGDNQTFIFERV